MWALLVRNRRKYAHDRMQAGNVSMTGRWRHKVRGTTVEAIGTGRVRPIRGWTPVVIYRDEAGQLLVSPAAEFMDGRFELIAADATDWITDKRY